MMLTKYGKNLIFTITLLGCCITLWLLAYAGGGVGSLVRNFGITIWVISPYCLIAVLTYFTQSFYKRIAILCGVVLCLLVNILYVDSLFIHTDAQGALIFLFLPAYQSVIMIVSICLGVGAGYFKEKLSRKTSE